MQNREVYIMSKMVRFGSTEGGKMTLQYENPKIRNLKIQRRLDRIVDDKIPPKNVRNFGIRGALILLVARENVGAGGRRGWGMDGVNGGLAWRGGLCGSSCLAHSLQTAKRRLICAVLALA